jgi:hypothetical protein
MKWRAKWIPLLLIIVLLMPNTVFAATDPTTTFELSSSIKELKVGEEVTVKIHARDLVNMYGFEVTTQYDDKKLKFIKGKTDLEGFTVAPLVKGNKVIFPFSKVGKELGFKGDQLLCELIFKAVQEGQANISLDQVKLVDEKLAMSEFDGKSEVSIKIAGRKTFTDISNSWAKDSIEEATELGFVEGYEDGTFRPQANVKRSEFIGFLMRALNVDVPTVEKLDFVDDEDIPTWAKGYIAKAVELGVTTGYEDNTFRANKHITRAEICAMLVRAAKIDVKAAANYELSFADKKQIPVWAELSVKASAKAGLVKGRAGNVVAPHDRATRAESVQFILNLLKSTK